MPVKRRRGKRRLHPRAELEAWSGAFECGHDFFSELEEIGFPNHVGGRQFDLTEEFREAARDAWNRLGAAFMED